MGDIRIGLSLTELELDALKRSVEKLLKDALYHGKYLDEQYAKKLMKKIAQAEEDSKAHSDFLLDYEEII